MEAIVRQTRQIFGDSLPESFLSRDEYLIYERLYGPPAAAALSEDVENLLMGKEVDESSKAKGEGSGTPQPPQNVLFREDNDGNLEEVIFEDDHEVDLDLAEEAAVAEDLEQADEESMPAEVMEEETYPEALEENSTNERSEPAEIAVQDIDSEATEENSVNEDGFSTVLESAARSYQAMLGGQAIHENLQARLDSLRQQIAVQRKEDALRQRNFQLNSNVEIGEESMTNSFEEVEEEEDFGALEDEIDEYDTSVKVRTHSMTKRGRFGTSPSTVQLPKASLVEPTSALFAEISNKQLRDVAQKTFGGKGLPNSTATIIRPNLRQATIPLEASHGQMGDMEANAYLAAIYPGAYASTMSALIEVRKRLGSGWLRNLMAQPDGPRILDAGSGGAAVLAWREVIKAEYESIHPELTFESEPPPFGKSTVLTGSHTLRQRAASLLEDTTFIPRLPDYDPMRDHPSLETSNPQPRKQYDIIVAPYTLWSLKEDHMRKSQIQNFWSLLSPNGGVLILIEKGVPRGFELIAGARETLLQHHISSPGAESPAIDSANPNRFTHKESGMIIAPCTNHSKCPMYITAGKTQGRKDFCRFNQRFIRPPYLQRILGENDTNHEDISFSYVALQRGEDLRKDESFVQGIPAADAAFEGYEDHDADNINGGDPTSKPPNPLTLPRAILPPIKRRGHVVLDLCTPAATIERWTVPKSFSKQAYRDARKSKWGDLWALGAKTRVRRNIRVGIKKVEDRETEEGEMQQSEEGEEEEVLGKRMEEDVTMEEGWSGKRKKSGIKAKAGGRERKRKNGRMRVTREDEESSGLG